MLKSFFCGKLALVFLFWISSLSCQSQQISQVEKERQLVYSVFLLLSQNHFLQMNFNQDFFDETVAHYLDATDWNKIFYLSSEEDLFRQLAKYRPGQEKLDQEIMNRIPNLLKIAYKSQDIFSERALEFKEYAEGYLSQKIDFGVDDTYTLDAEKRSRAADKDEMRKEWGKYLKYLTLNRILTTLPKGEESNSPTVFSSNEADARAHVLAQMKSLSQNLQTRKSDQYIEIYLNAVGEAYDQYTAYYSPVENENFNIQMTGQLEGIGAQISKEEDGLIEIKGIVPGGPTYKQKALVIGDKIMKIDDGNGNFLDVVTLSMNEALSYIRGKKGTVAKFVIKRISGEVDNVEIVRGRVILEESYARSTIIETQIPGSPPKKIGYLYLPSFYGDRRNSQAPNSSDDVKKELLYFNSQGVDSMIFDLRNNGGGYLDDAVNISGFFIERGPVVRIRGREGEFEPKSDTDPSVVFTKPMVVMINENSASASEIFAAAMQDYGRAVVVGAPQSFGKATVQTVLEYDKQPYLKNIADIAGSLKYTIQKYYRITGKSTQTIGVIPDVILPTLWIKSEVKKDPYAQDALPVMNFKRWDGFKYDISELKSASYQRTKKAPFFNNVEKRLQIMKERQKEDAISLNFKKAKAQNDVFLKQIVNYDLNIAKAKVPYKVLDGQQESEQLSPEKQEEIKNWNKQILDDYYLEEGVMILNDIIR